MSFDGGDRGGDVSAISLTLGVLLEADGDRPFFSCDHRLARRHAGADKQGQESDGGAGHDRLVALGKLAEMVETAVRLGEDWLAGEIPLDVLGKIGRRGVTAAGLFREGLADDRRQIAAVLQIDGAEVWGIVLTDAPYCLGDRDRPDVEGQSARQQLEGDDPEGVDVRAGVDLVRPRAHLLGTHVRQGPDQKSRDRGHRVRRHLLADDPRHAEVKDPGLAASVHQDVVRFEIAVDDAVTMCVLHGVTDLDHQGHPGARTEATVLGVARQRDALDQLHRVIRNRFAVARTRDARFIDVSYSGMAKAPEDFRLALEAGAGLFGKEQHP